MTHNAIVDRDAALNLIDELRVAVPEEVRAAKRINQEGERIIEKAQQEAEHIVARAQEQAAYLIGERGLTDAAEDEARRIIAEAEEDAALIRHGADEYAAGVLGSLEAEVSRTLNGIERGLALLEDRRAAYVQEQAPAPVESLDQAYAPADAYDGDLDAEEGAETVGRR